MIRLTVVLSLFLPTFLYANSLPAMFTVTGLAVDDTLNVRSAPNMTGDIIATLPQGTPVEVTAFSQNNRWARINVSERTGWIARQFLSTPARASWPPETLTCHGTEPFWSLNFNSAGEEITVTFNQMAHIPRNLQASAWDNSENRTDRHSIHATERDATNRVTAIVAHETCTDGMSDRVYGLTIDLLVDRPTARHLSGCCSLQP